jgi:hypothetical protein
MCKEGLGGDVRRSLPLCPFHCVPSTVSLPLCPFHYRMRGSAALSRQSVRSAMER